MISPYLMGLSVLVFAAGLLDSSISQGSWALVLFPLLYFTVFDFAVNLLYLHLLEGTEEHIGTTNYAVVYLLGCLVGNAGLFLQSPVFGVSGASAGVLAVFGVYAVRNPYKLAIANLVPLPAIVSILFLLATTFFATGRFDIFPLFVGIGLGLCFSDHTPPASPVASYARRY